MNIVSIEQIVNKTIQSMHELFCLFADLSLQEETITMNCGKNWNNEGSPQSILVERPAVRRYWVSIFQVRNEKN